MARVYDVTKGKDYYGPGGGYAFFSGRDGSRAFVSGQFDEAGLIDDVRGLSSSDYLGLKQWEEFYAKDYKKVGLLEGRFYNKQGEVTEEWKQLQRDISAAVKEQDTQDSEKKVFPPCNVEWTKEKGTRFWCTAKSGGIARTWIGVPRKLFYPGRDERCACVRDTGSPSTDPGASSNRGDLDNPHLKQYQDCPPDSFECWNKAK
ncbi:neuferricin [Eurytemora carolleeae]|uniref:neuferricin n=1 Tax=Eurytemora carolleeae TaxID=1294199 RepID=UPI000C76C79F|nr:neuferricin [Eurytemora carolleeae]|eukprot:XP_023333620.1 neuferricin-like [Eurytemora affinis]